MGGVYISEALFLTMARQLAADTVREMIESGEIARITADTFREMVNSGQFRATMLDALGTR